MSGVGLKFESKLGDSDDGQKAQELLDHVNAEAALRGKTGEKKDEAQELLTNELKAI